MDVLQKNVNILLHLLLFFISSRVYFFLFCCVYIVSVRSFPLLLPKLVGLAISGSVRCVIHLHMYQFCKVVCIL